MGKIIETFPGTDGKIRSAKVETSVGSYDRPITKLCLLISKKEYEMQKETNVEKSIDSSQGGNGLN